MTEGFLEKDVYFLPESDISYLEALLHDPAGNLRVLPYSELKDIPQADLSIFCNKYGYYCLPTQELINFLKTEIGLEKRVIEIGSGNGVIGKALGIHATDNYMQTQTKYKRIYTDVKQTPVTYGPNVEKLEALNAVNKYKPKIVIAAWVTEKYNPREDWRGGNELGVNEKKLLLRIKKYIFIGNEVTHRGKPILELPHKTYKAPWLLSRSIHRGENAIFIWE